MSSSTLLARPSLATLSFGVAGATWSGLLVATGMMLAAEGRFAANPIYTLAVAVAITSTTAGIQLRCHTGGQAAEGIGLHHLRAEPTIEISRPARYISSPVRVPVSGELMVRDSGPPTTADVAELLPSPSTVAAMRRLAAKVTRAAD